MFQMTKQDFDNFMKMIQQSSNRMWKRERAFKLNYEPQIAGDLSCCGAAEGLSQDRANLLISKKEMRPF